MLTMWAMGMKSDPSMMCNGMLSGLVAITAPCAFVDSWAAVAIGAIAGVIVVCSVFFWDRVGVDDPVGAISVHGVNGLWGVTSVGIFANGKYGAGWNGVVRDAMVSEHGSDGVRGILFGDPSQLFAQLVDVGVLARLRVPYGIRLVQVQQPDHADSRQPGDGNGRPGRARDGCTRLSGFHNHITQFA